MDIIEAILEILEVIIDIFKSDKQASQMESTLSELELHESLDESSAKYGI